MYFLSFYIHYYVTSLLFILFVFLLFFIFLLSLIPGTVSTFAGSEKSGNTDGSGTSAMFNTPLGIAIDQQSGNLFVCELGNNLIRKVSSNGVYKKRFYLCVHHQSDIFHFIFKKQEKYQHLLVHNKDFLMEMANQHSSMGYMIFSLMKTVNHYLFVISVITSSEGFNSMVIYHLSKMFVFLTLKQGEVSTLCEINQTISVAVAADNTILVGSASNKLFKVTHQSEFNLQNLSIPFLF
jgi:hypothetical protein